VIHHAAAAAARTGKRKNHVPYGWLSTVLPSCFSSKRGLDLGLSRGYSGTQAAKHLMGMAAANFAGGPGRRRRSDVLPKLLAP